MFKVIQLVVAELGGVGRPSYPWPLQEGLHRGPEEPGGGKTPCRGGCFRGISTSGDGKGTSGWATV